MLSFGRALKTCLLTKILSSHDRAPRSEFWWYFLFVLAINALSYFVKLPHSYFIWFVHTLIMMIINVGLLTAGVRRLHDLNRSGRWFVLPQLSILVFLAVMFLFNNDNPTLNSAIDIVMMVWAGYALLLLLFMLKKGTKGFNNYGADPLEPSKEPQQESKAA